MESKKKYKEIGFLSWLGIICMPLIFGWFTFREGYPPIARIIASILLIYVFYLTFESFL